LIVGSNPIRLAAVNRDDLAMRRTAMADPTTVDEYLAALPEDRRGPMETLRETIRAAAPDADEVITYKMPGFTRRGRFLVSYDAFKQHYSLFPASDEVVRGLGDEIAPYVAGRSTIRFPASRPIPVDLVTKVIRIRLAESDAATGERG
jgi:uncharacterized protein YdhG (YjbR/CyaY superfamily)